MPLAYRAPTTLPALVPDTTTGSKPLASSILITPMWAKPLAAPPPSAMPIFTGLACGTTVGAGGGAGRTGSPPQPASRPIRATDSSMRGRNRLIGSALAALDSGKGASIPKRWRGGQGGEPRPFRKGVR